MNWFVTITVVLLSALLGFVLGKAPYIALEPKLDMDDLVTLFINILLFLTVQLLYVRHMGDRRTERDLIIELVRKTLQAAEDLRLDYEDVREESTLTDRSAILIKSGKQRLSNDIHSIEQAIKHCKLDKKSNGFEIVQSARIEYLDALTDTPFPERFDRSARRHHDGLHKKLVDALHKFMFNINRC